MSNTRSALGNANRATVLINGRQEIHLKFNSREELERGYRELDALEGRSLSFYPSPNTFTFQVEFRGTRIPETRIQPGTDSRDALALVWSKYADADKEQILRITLLAQSENAA